MQRKIGLKRSGFKKKTAKKTTAKKRRVRSPMQKAKDKLWDECRRIIKNRYGNVCYTCYALGLEKSNWQTGHFIPSSICSVAMRYDLANLRPQCMQCNIHKSGNWVEYEKHLKLECGEDEPDRLKALNEATKGMQYDILWYQEKLAEYKKL